MMKESDEVFRLSTVPVSVFNRNLGLGVKNMTVTDGFASKPE